VLRYIVTFELTCIARVLAMETVAHSKKYSHERGKTQGGTAIPARGCGKILAI
jgi:hypothetical protein